MGTERWKTVGLAGHSNRLDEPVIFIFRASLDGSRVHRVPTISMPRGKSKKGAPAADGAAALSAEPGAENATEVGETTPVPRGKGKGARGKGRKGGAEASQADSLVDAQADHTPTNESEQGKAAECPAQADTAKGDAKDDWGDDGWGDDGWDAGDKGGGAGEAGTTPDKERVLRHDDECFLADYTVNQSEQPSTPKFRQFELPQRARIARELIELDPEVELRIRKLPSKDAEEIRVLTADDIVEVVGTCGEWLRLAGNDEQWIKYMQSENAEIPEQLVDVLGPSLLSVASSLTSGWFSGASDGAASAEQGNAPASAGDPQEAGSKASGGASSGGWGFGGWGKSLTDRVSAVAASASATVLAVGGEDQDVRAGTNSVTLSSTLKEAASDEANEEDIGTDIADTVSRNFDKEVNIDEGGLASVRMASQAISMFEGGLGWLGSTATTAAARAQETAKTTAQTVAQTAQNVKETVTNEEFVDGVVDRAWSTAKSGVQVSGSVATSATNMAKNTTSAVVNSDVVNNVKAIGKSAAVTVGSNALKVMTTAKTTLVGEDEIDEELLYPNRALGGVIAIEISGCIIQRDPHVDDEDEDPFMSDDYSATPMTPGALEAVQRLVRERFQDQAYLMCVAAPQVQARMLRWLSNKDFYEQTGMTREKVHFCREWDEKVDVCKELGVTVAVEASSSSTGSLERVVDTALLFGGGADVLQGDKPRQDGEAGTHSQLWWESVCAELLPRPRVSQETTDVEPLSNAMPEAGVHSDEQVGAFTATSADKEVEGSAAASNDENENSGAPPTFIESRKTMGNEDNFDPRLA